MKYVAMIAFVAVAGCGMLGFGKRGASADQNDVAPIAGMVCGNPALRGTAIGAVEGPGACGIPDAISLEQVGGLILTTPAKIDCVTATSLLQWVEGTVKPTFADQGTATGLRVAASYSCRTRNHRAGARLSEHSYGHAIDISAIKLADGTMVTVLDDWSGSPYSSAMRSLHEGACGPFGTVLGPRSDVYHQDHFHFDTARYRSGPYCR